MRKQLDLHDDHARTLLLFVKAGGADSGHGMQVWLASALGVTRQMVAHWYKQGFPVYALRCLEFLEVVPEKRWPDAWRLLHRKSSISST